jgi:hypothetical protein
MRPRMALFFLASIVGCEGGTSKNSLQRSAQSRQPAAMTGH